MNAPIQVNLFDSNFSHAAGSVGTKIPRLVEWVRGQMVWDGLTVFTDGWISSPIAQQVESRYKVGWLHEAKALRPAVYEATKAVRHQFDFILTTDPELLAFDPACYKRCIRGGVWAPRHEWGMHPKSKGVAMILSDKTQLEGHQIRHEIAESVPGIDLFGYRGIAIGTNKRLAYQDYRFAVIIEAVRQENWFSEHLLDAIAYDCVPIYWGCPNIGDYLNTSGMLHCRNEATLYDAIDAVQTGFLAGCAPLFQASIRDNLERLPEIEITEDWLAQRFFLPLLNGEVAA